MKIEIYTQNPTSLSARIFEKAENGDLRTWNIRKSKNGEQFLTHASQWKDAALIQLIPNGGNLTVTICWWENSEPEDYTKCIYLGRFSEALLNHFNGYFTSFETFYK